MHIISILHANKNLTGGNRYNARLEAELDKLQSTPVERFAQPYERYSQWAKPLAFLGELRLLRAIHRGDWVILGDFAYRYHMLLLWICRHWKNSYNTIIIHHFQYLEYRGIKRWWKEMIMDAYFSMADRIIVPSPFTRDLAERKFGKERVCYIPLPFEQNYHASQAYHQGDLLYVGSIEPRKGIHFLPALLSRLKVLSNKSIRLRIVGKATDNAYMQTVQHQAELLGVTDMMEWLGQVNHERLHALYDQSEAFVFPSQLEGYGIVLIEAMQHGLPVVAFNNSAMPYTIHHMQNGLLAENANIEQMADCLNDLLNNPALHRQLQQGMEQTIRELHTEQDFADAIGQLYQQITTPQHIYRT